MKKTYLLFLLLCGASGFAQSANADFESLVNAEKKSASRRMTVVLNPDTYNYDVTYHKLEFTVDPAVFNIAGKVTTTYTALSPMTTLVFDLSRITDESDPNYDNQIVVEFGQGKRMLTWLSREMMTELIIMLAGNAGRPVPRQPSKSIMQALLREAVLARL